MNGPHQMSVGAGVMLEIIAFRLHDQEFCVRTTPSARFADGGRRPRSHMRPPM